MGCSRKFSTRSRGENGYAMLDVDLEASRRNKVMNIKANFRYNSNYKLSPGCNLDIKWKLLEADPGGWPGIDKKVTL